jgi:hypothetical protein
MPLALHWVSCSTSACGPGKPHGCPGCLAMFWCRGCVCRGDEKRYVFSVHKSCTRQPSYTFGAPPGAYLVNEVVEHLPAVA